MGNPRCLGSGATALAALVTLVVVATAPAQERKPAFGRVVDGKGVPVAGASVELLGAFPNLGEELAPFDRLTVATDARGRWRAALLPGRVYSARASVIVAGPSTAADDRPTLSATVSHVACGRSVDFTIDRRPLVRRLVVDGVEAWQQHGPLRVRVAPMPCGRPGTRSRSPRTGPPSCRRWRLACGPSWWSTGRASRCARSRCRAHGRPDWRSHRPCGSPRAPSTPPARRWPAPGSSRAWRCSSVGAPRARCSMVRWKRGGAPAGSPTRAVVWMPSCRRCGTWISAT